MWKKKENVIQYIYIHIYTLEIKDYENNSPQFRMITIPYLNNSLWWKPISLMVFGLPGYIYIYINIILYIIYIRILIYITTISKENSKGLPPRPPFVKVTFGRHFFHLTAWRPVWVLPEVTQISIRRQRLALHLFPWHLDLKHKGSEAEEFMKTLPHAFFLWKLIYQTMFQLVFSTM